MLWLLVNSYLNQRRILFCFLIVNDRFGSSMYVSDTIFLIRYAEFVWFSKGPPAVYFPLVQVVKRVSGWFFLNNKQGAELEAIWFLQDAVCSVSIT